jgi:diguanylate cyclase (GGDEF)-like protein
MGLNATELSLLAVELLAALALLALWLGDRSRAFTLWWALAHLMLPVPALLTAATRGHPSPLNPVTLLLYLSLATQAVCLVTGVISFRSRRWQPRPRHALLAIAVLSLLFVLPAVILGNLWGRYAATTAMTVALLASALLMWSSGRIERFAALFLGLRGGLQVILLAMLVLGRYDSAWFNHFTSFNALTATGTALALLVAAYQLSLERLRDQYRSLELSQELTARVQGITDEQELARQVLAVISQRLRWEQATFMSLTATPMTFEQTATLGVEPALATLAPVITIPPGGMISEALTTQRIQFSADLARDQRVTDAYRNHPSITLPLSQVVIPIVHHSEALGVIVLRDRGHRELSETKKSTLESLGRVVGLSLTNARNLRELAHRADHDALTGLGNRAALHEYLQEEIDRFPERRSAVLLFDLDHFKQVNDALGHAVGDQLLQALAARLQQHFAARPASIFRLGGDEFVILHRVDEQYDGLALARELADLIAQPLQISGLSLRTPASIGVAIAPEHGRNSHELLRCADVAMYHAKQQGCGTTLYERSIDAHKLEHLTLLSAVDDGLDRDQFELFYQPFINLDSGDIEGCEGLIRWRHPTLGLIGANEFIPLIEATDLIRAITRRVIDIAMRDAASWQQAGVDRRIAINLSARNILDPELPPYLLAAAERHGVAPDRIQLEITETILIKDPASAGAVMQRLADAGFTLALDDFGTGYSSLAYLARFPIHTLKIDRSFVRNMLDHSQSRTIVESTISLARGLGLRVTAEGVEQQAEADLLRRLGCDCAQGFLFSRPVPMRELA